MSVHGEYSRALESLLSRVRELADPAAAEWIDALEGARVDRNPDLSTAATRCMDVLDALDAAWSVTRSTDCEEDAHYLRDPFDHLRAHCRSLLGIAS
jgi:hypothetical protein